MDQKIICDAEDLTAIADAVRTSTGSTNTYNVPELSAAAVNAIGTRVNIDETLTISGAAADAKVTGDRIAELTKPPELIATGHIVQYSTPESSPIIVKADANVIHSGKNLFEVGYGEDDYIKKVYLMGVDHEAQTICMKVSEGSYSHAIRSVKIPFVKGKSIHVVTECADDSVNVAIPMLRVENADGEILTSGCTGTYIDSYTGFIPSNHGDVPPPPHLAFLPAIVITRHIAA